MYGLCGLNQAPYGISRLVVHIVCAVLVVRLARELELGRASQAMSGALFAASPVAFESLFWGTGITEQFGTLFGLWAVALLFGSSRRKFALSFVLITLSVFSKESGYFLPLVWAYVAFGHGMPKVNIAAVVCSLVGITGVAVRLVGVDLAGSGDYPLSLVDIPRNFMVYGFWLVSPPQFMRGLELGSIPVVLMGAIFWAIWGVSAASAYTRGNRKIVVLLAFCVLPLLPATLVGDHAVPRYLYSSVPALALSIALFGATILSNISLSRAFPLVLLLSFYSQTSTAYRLDARWPSGVPIHRLVAKEKISHRMFNALRSSGPPPSRRVVFLDPGPQSGVTTELLKAAVGDDLGVRTVIGNEFTVSFQPAVLPGDRGAVVLKVDSIGKVSFGTF